MQLYETLCYIYYNHSKFLSAFRLQLYKLSIHPIFYKIYLNNLIDFFLFTMQICIRYMMYCRNYIKSSKKPFSQNYYSNITDFSHCITLLLLFIFQYCQYIITISHFFPMSTFVLLHIIDYMQRWRMYHTNLLLNRFLMFKLI